MAENFFWARPGVSGDYGRDFRAGAQARLCGPQENLTKQAPFRRAQDTVQLQGRYKKWIVSNFE